MLPCPLGPKIVPDCKAQEARGRRKPPLEQAGPCRSLRTCRRFSTAFSPFWTLRFLRHPTPATRHCPRRGRGCADVPAVTGLTFQREKQAINRHTSEVGQCVPSEKAAGVAGHRREAGGRGSGLRTPPRAWRCVPTLGWTRQPRPPAGSHVGPLPSLRLLPPGILPFHVQVPDISREFHEVSSPPSGHTCTISTAPRFNGTSPSLLAQQQMVYCSGAQMQYASATDKEEVIK